MDLYEAITDYAFTLPAFQAWDEVKRIFERIASAQPRDWKLPLLALQAVGGPVEQGAPAAAALACAQIGIILIDDMLDDDPRGEYRQIGAAQTANLASVFLCAASQSILHSLAQPEVKLKALQVLDQMIVNVALGQSLDVQNPRDEEAYWRVVENKSAAFFGAAIHLGALLGCTVDDTARKLESIGRIYGEMIQIHDDLHDTMETPANPDWIQRRAPLPILFAQLVDHPDRARFMQLYENISNEGTLQEAQGILIRCGAVSYCVDQLIQRHRKAQAILDATSLVQREDIASLLDAVIAPVHQLMESCEM